MNTTTLSLFKSTPGAMSVCEGLALSRLAYESGGLRNEGIYIESGSHSGKSTVAIASALHRGCELHMIDPDFKRPTSDILNDLKSASEATFIFHIAPSVEALPRIAGELSFVFLDSGDHSYELCRAECYIVALRIVKGGIIALHDLDSQFKGVRQCYDELLATGEFEEIKIPWDDILKEVILGRLEDGNQTYHHTELANPMFLGALRKL
jgi:predicted O-methyltransferase YrrM